MNYKRKDLFIICVVLFSSVIISCNTVKEPESPKLTNEGIERRIDSIINVMTLEEKIQMLCGNGLFSSAGIERLGIRDIYYTDGPFGIREELGKKSWMPKGLTIDSATFLPTGSALAATWNPEMANQYGIILGEEARTRGKDVLLGPAVNITRTPLNGRTYEYFSEDPFLNSVLAVNYVKGVQSTGVAACVKHFAMNNQETRRGDVNVIADERTLREIYLPPFKAAVTEGGAYSVMAAYNKFRGDWCAENDYLLNKILREEWNFQGLVISDWGGTHSTVKSALNGLDVEMGSEKYFTMNMLDSVKDGKIPVQVIDDKVRRILRVWHFVSKNSRPDSSAMVSTPEHNNDAYEIASQSIVLLKNSKKMLPIDLKRIKSVAVIGENAVTKHAQGGFGAGVKTRYEVTPLEGLKNRLGNDVNIQYAQGYRSKFIRWFVPDNSSDQKLIDEAVKVARQTDMAILFVGTNRNVETESYDRADLILPFGQDDLIKAVCKANRNTVIVMVAGAPVNMHVADSCSDAIVWSWFNGSQGGYALADVLTGSVNPSGKLPFTIPVKLEDSPVHALGVFPGNDDAEYAEGLLVGYRWYDTKEISPLYPFGHGLSYTTFDYTNISTDKDNYRRDDIIRISVSIKNSGTVDGMETVQIYAGQTNSDVLKPVRELKGFKKVSLKSGEETMVTLDLPVKDLAWFNAGTGKWQVSTGQYRIAAGSSSRNIRKIKDIEIK